MNDGFCACTECVHVYKSGCVAHVCVCVCPSAAVYSMCQKPVRSKGKVLYTIAIATYLKGQSLTERESRHGLT